MSKTRRMLPHMFVNQSGTAICWVQGVDISHARLEIQNANGTHSSYAMPIKEYDRNFIASWRPATEEDYLRLIAVPKDFRLPENAPSDWAWEED